MQREQATEIKTVESECHRNNDMDSDRHTLRQRGGKEETARSHCSVSWKCIVLMCGMESIALWCVMEWCIAVCHGIYFNVLMECIAVYCRASKCVAVRRSASQCVAVRRRMLRCVAVCCRALQRIAQCVAVCCAVCCRVLQCVAAFSLNV